MPDWVDGLPAGSLSVKDRGLAYGDGVFETMAVKAGRPLLLDRHLQRLETGCQRLAISVDLALVHSEMTRFAAELGDGVMKLILTRGDGQRGYAPAANACSRRILQGSAAPAYPAAHAEQGVRLFACQTRLAEQPLLAGLKHLNRLEQVMARSEWSDSEHAEGLMRDTSGRLIEGVYSNLFLVCGGRLLTADLSRCGVAGVMRAALLDQARNLGLAVEIRDLHLPDLETADEVFLCNSVYGVWPVCGFAALDWAVGPLTRKLQVIARTLLDI
ncbi:MULTISPECIES: aminodeoxychorismate lyase [Pseudomonas syringae group]|uniref:aminodeoxychorismate lyase n=1 Tax=Pseudomonas syringae group TaxID=136849 RepID=UPI000EFFCF8F|nr:MULTISPECIES: aminodeoxychorismate lyase [Pseudomonas syringae group]MCF5713507.1 aminodeoxychorismate lyase [Pseudomonas tremae]MCF5746223.1 aminodeoxychorismate lyase [Pseudomonas tremae]RMP20546.1 4-amino-4-deoxychorismate lyase [Pseudomonas coronafaciens pv. atropurpurea]UQB30086.1 aminodeoxychorismate lyase [Pseudomonas tremae]UQB35190.1 aminodeoxychorismate lyase [Pseudomonas tremae]